MEPKIVESRTRKNIVQFSVFAENKVGCLNLILQRMLQNVVHIMAISCIDQTDCAVLRIVPNYPEAAEKTLADAGTTFSKCNVLALELDQNEDLVKITRALCQAEINIHYLYPFVCRPHEKSGIILACDAPELAEKILSAHGLAQLELDDLAR